jgi:hypothetical protein
MNVTSEGNMDPILTSSTWQLSDIEDVDAGAHIKNIGVQGESSNPRFIPKAVSRKLQKSLSQAPGNGKQVVKNRLYGSGPPTHNFSPPNNNNTEHVISHEFLKNDPAFNPARVPGHKNPSTANIPRGSKLFHANAKNTTKGMARSVLHPRRSIIQHYRGKTAKGLSKATRPYLTPQADREFLAEYDALFEAEYSRARGRGTDHQKTNGTIFTNTLGGVNMGREERQIDESWKDGPRAINYELQRKKVELLEAHRQSLAVAWITGRYIKRVRLAPWLKTQRPSFRDESFSERYGEDGETRFRWENYLSEVRLRATTK